MKFTLEVNNSTEYKFSKKFFLDVFKCTLKLVDEVILNQKELELSLALVGENEIAVLNNQYRKKNAPTDVLSFCEYEKTADLLEQNAAKEIKHIFLGELIICPDYIQKNANEDGETLEYALTYITAHGILHLLGFEHGQKMFALQKQVADELIK